MLRHHEEVSCPELILGYNPSHHTQSVAAMDAHEIVTSCAQLPVVRIPLSGPHLCHSLERFQAGACAVADATSKPVVT